MRIALLNDSHGGARQENLHFNDYFFKFFDNVFFPYLKEHNITTICHLGDLMDRRKYVNYVIANSWRTKFFDKTRKMKLDTHAIPGNHDVPYRNTNEINSIEELTHGYKNWHVYSNPKEIVFDGLPILFVPWINNTNYEQCMTAMRDTKAKVCFGHFELSGFEMDAGNVCATGMDRNILDKFDLVASGHFHHKSTDGRIYYLGAQYQMTWGDYGDEKGFHVFDTGTLELEFVKNPYVMYNKIWYDDTKQDLKYWTDYIMDDLVGTYVKVVVSNKENPYLFDKMMDRLYAANPLEIVVAEDYGTIYEESDEAVNEAEDTVTILDKYVSGLQFPPNIEQEKVKRIMRELYVEAVNTENQ